MDSRLGTWSESAGFGRQWIAERRRSKGLKAIVDLRRHDLDQIGTTTSP